MATATQMALAAVVMVAYLVTITSACVPPHCVWATRFRTVDGQPPYNMQNPWIILSIVLGAIFFLVILIILIYMCCLCCGIGYWGAVRGKHVHHKQVIVQKKEPKKLLHVITPPPEAPPPPSEPIVICPPPCPPPEPPQSLLLTVSDGTSAAGPAISTRVERPLTFTLSPQYGGPRMNLGYEESSMGYGGGSMLGCDSHFHRSDVCGCDY